MSGAGERASRLPLAGGSGCEHRQKLLVRTARAVGVDRLDADMVGPGIPMLLDALADRRLVAPGDIGVDEAVRAAIRQLVAKAEPAPVVGVIVELQVRRQRLARGRA